MCYVVADAQEGQGSQDICVDMSGVRAEEAEKWVGREGTSGAIGRKILRLEVRELLVHFASVPANFTDRYEPPETNTTFSGPDMMWGDDYEIGEEGTACGSGHMLTSLASCQRAAAELLGLEGKPGKV